MNKLITLFILSISISATSQVPDWTVMSCNGTNYNMHAQLANNRAVILDFSALWCGPCADNATEIQAVWEHYGEGSNDVRVFEFLLQDESYAEANCANLQTWEAELALTYPGFANANVAEIFNQYNLQYGSNSIPLILMFMPDPDDPGASTLVYNYADNLGTTTGDISDDIGLLLTQNGYSSVGIPEFQYQGEKELVMVVDFLGRETTYKANEPLILIYSDGSRERVMQLAE